jgi:hypothetical protein
MLKLPAPGDASAPVERRRKFRPPALLADRFIPEPTVFVASTKSAPELVEGHAPTSLMESRAAGADVPMPTLPLRAMVMRALASSAASTFDASGARTRNWSPTWLLLTTDASHSVLSENCTCEVAPVPPT